MQTFTFKSSNEINTVQGYIFECENPKAILQISHGMCEYFLRYTKFAEYMNKNGFIVCGNDHIGHGKSISKSSDRGFFAQNNGHNYLIDDLHKVTTVIKEKYPNLPLILLGHSMGSLILRYYLTKYAYELNGAIICGTIGPNPTNKVSKLICNMFVKIKGAKTPSPFLDAMAFGSFNKKISPLKTEKDWLTRD
ncbi:MAG: alpha/beta fold hydrolase, partial [Oscillospiraceae bacterium]